MSSSTLIMGCSPNKHPLGSTTGGHLFWGCPLPGVLLSIKHMEKFLSVFVAQLIFRYNPFTPFGFTFQPRLYPTCNGFQMIFLPLFGPFTRHNGHEFLDLPDLATTQKSHAHCANHKNYSVM